MEYDGDYDDYEDEPVSAEQAGKEISFIAALAAALIDE